MLKTNFLGSGPSVSTAAASHEPSGDRHIDVRRGRATNSVRSLNQLTSSPALASLSRQTRRTLCLDGPVCYDRAWRLTAARALVHAGNAVLRVDGAALGSLRGEGLWLRRFRVRDHGHRGAAR